MPDNYLICLGSIYRKQFVQSFREIDINLCYLLITFLFWGLKTKYPKKYGEKGFIYF